ncbi:MAG: hypothetical protein AAB929_05385 [Patescibacteria group bacterium]
MQTIYLSREHVADLVEANKYKIDHSLQFISRCIDDRYHNIDHPASLALPGADPGELALILATGNSYGFKVDKAKVFKTLVAVVGGVKNLQMHTDSHNEEKDSFKGCGHMSQLETVPETYDLTQEDVEFVLASFNLAKSHHANEVVLEGQHKKNAVVIVKGDYGILPRHYLEVNGQKLLVEVFEYHQTLVDKRHRALAQELIKNGGVKLIEGQDEESLFEAFGDIGENHLMETLRSLAKSMPIYEVQFDEEGEYEVVDLGVV